MDDIKRAVDNINPYLTEHEVDVVTASRRPVFTDVIMDYGVYYSKSAGLILNSDEKDELVREGFSGEALSLCVRGHKML